jgi:transposase-like protein
MTKPIPSKISTAIRYFSTPGIPETLLRQLRWPDGKMLCPYCGHSEIGSIATRLEFCCKRCRKQFSLKVGTLFEDSKLELGQWFLALFVLLRSPGITCQQQADLLGVTLRTAWKMRTKLIRALPLHHSGSYKILLGQILKLPKK